MSSKKRMNGPHLFINCKVVITSMRMKTMIPRNVNIRETEGRRDIEGPGVELPFVGQRVKIKKVNIGTDQAPKLSNVGDYWDDSTINKITKLLHEYQDLFVTNFIYMKGIKGPMGEMKIPLKT